MRREDGDPGADIEVLGRSQEPRRAVLDAARDLDALELVVPAGGS